MAGWGEKGALEAIEQVAELIDRVALRIEQAIWPTTCALPWTRRNHQRNRGSGGRLILRRPEHAASFARACPRAAGRFVARATEDTLGRRNRVPNRVPESANLTLPNLA